ncbi:uncharacterized protein LOC134246282 [Saccostrea cucullata]|uniref:uncharacterized protein LOC134246282 n=1 Tax=Saccostrea cuccullata TaxID=36930 RepID=UPI002ED32F87
MAATFGIFVFICLNTVRISGYDDISKFKTTAQSSLKEDNQHFSPEKAVDKDISTCSSTGADNPAWWYVDLQEIKSIHDIQIHFDGTNTENGT